MDAAATPPSARRAELLELAYAYVLEQGLAHMSLRPLAQAVGSSPRVLLYCFGSKDDLVRCLLDRARADELALLAEVRGGDPAEVGRRVWAWLGDPGHRGLLTIWVEAYARSLVEPDGPWAGFARQSVDDWLRVLATCQPAHRRRSHAGAAERTRVLAVLRGGMLDLLATGEQQRVDAAVRSGLRAPPVP